MIPFSLLPFLPPHMRPVLCGLRSGSLVESRRLSFRARIAPESLARLFTLQPLRLLVAVALMVLLAVASTAISIVKVEPVSVEDVAAGAHVQATDRIDVLDMTRWQY